MGDRQQRKVEGEGDPLRHISPGVRLAPGNTLAHAAGRLPSPPDLSGSPRAWLAVALGAPRHSSSFSPHCISLLFVMGFTTVGSVEVVLV